MPLKNRTGVEVLKLKDLASAEIDELVYELRYQDAELAEYDRTMTEEEEQSREPLSPELELTVSMSIEDALAELRQAEREDRLLIEWKRGWLYFFYGLPIDDPDGECADDDMREFLTRVPRPKARHRYGLL